MDLGVACRGACGVCIRFREPKTSDGRHVFKARTLEGLPVHTVHRFGTKRESSRDG